MFCPLPLWTLWPTAPLGSFISVSLAWGDRKPERPQSLLLLFHISLLVTGLTSPQGTRGTERGWDEKKGRRGKKRGNWLKKRPPRGKKKGGRCTVTDDKKKKGRNVVWTSSHHNGNVFERAVSSGLGLGNIMYVCSTVFKIQGCFYFLLREITVLD